MLATVARSALPEGYRIPLTLRYRLPGLRADPGESDTEYRFKLYIPPKALSAGHSAVGDLAATTARSFERMLEAKDLDRFLAEDQGDS